MKKLLKSWLPLSIYAFLQKLKQKRYGWVGNYRNWAEAQNDAIGYDDELILEKVRKSLLKVKNSKAVYERDSVIFDEIQYSWPVLAGLMYASSRSNGSLRVLDFGGSLGSTYYQNKKFLDGLHNVSWSIVEQKHFIDIGKRDFEDERLRFYYDVDSCVTNENPNVLLLSSVLQYIENWESTIQSILSFSFDIVIVDLTPFSLRGQKRITVQKVPPTIYSAAYPCWIFNEDELKFFFEDKYTFIETFKSMEGLRIYLGQNDEAIYKGFIMEKNR